MWSSREWQWGHWCPLTLSTHHWGEPWQKSVSYEGVGEMGEPCSCPPLPG